MAVFKNSMGKMTAPQESTDFEDEPGIWTEREREKSRVEEESFEVVSLPSFLHLFFLAKIILPFSNPHRAKRERERESIRGVPDQISIYNLR